MYILFPIRFYRLHWCNGYLASLPRWRPRFDSRGRKYFFVFNLIFPIFLYILQQEFSSVLHKIQRTSQKFSPAAFFLFIYFFINFQIQTALSQLWLQICGYVIFKFAFCQVCVAIFFKSKFPTNPTQNPC